MEIGQSDWARLQNLANALVENRSQERAMLRTAHGTFLDESTLIPSPVCVLLEQVEEAFAQVRLRADAPTPTKLGINHIADVAVLLEANPNPNCARFAQMLETAAATRISHQLRPYDLHPQNQP